MMNDSFRNNPEKRWIYFTDTVMGGRSSGDVNFKNASQISYARLTGNVTTENNGGFIQIRKQISGLDEKILGIELRAKGNNQIYHVFIRTTGTILPWQYYKVEFLVNNSWKKIKIPIKDFQRSGVSYLKELSLRQLKVSDWSLLGETLLLIYIFQKFLFTNLVLINIT